MSTEGEKRCPLCAEEMDWTDQQFKPCKCGYQVCVWCWHHIIDMAEKDAREGRCPACRAVYEKEKIVAMQADCERATAPCNKKSKPPKTKPKTVEVKKDLTTVRVIQRKMAYVIGLPLSLADEDLLRRKEYFGQYGKITKISLSRTSGGAIQQFINDSCSIYVTYSREEEAVRCIHSVHGFMLEGRYLRASFGTAKYCHAWLRNMPCINSSCLYLHTLGADEDSFGRDEAASVHTRNRVHEVAAGASSNIVKRSGIFLPPPIDDYVASSSSSLERSIGRSSVSDPVHGDHSNSGKVTTFVDIVGRPSSKGSEKYEGSAEDRRMLGQSSVTKEKDICSNALPHEVPSSGLLVSRVPRDRISHESCDELVREDVTHSDDFSPNESSSMTQRTFHSSSNSTRVSEDSSGHTRLHQRTRSSSSFSIDQSSVHSLEDEASLPFTCVKSVLNDQGNELKFQTSAKSDRIYRSSNSFSNEEIVEHLRRIGGENATYDDEKCALDAVESSIISNIMSIDLDSLDDSLTLPHGLTELLDETDDQRGSSWDSFTSRESGFSFSRPDGFAGASFESPHNNLGQVSNSSAREHYFSNSQHQAPRAPCLAPPGFSLPSEAPPGFSSYDNRTARYPHSSSGSFANVSSPPNSFHQMPLSGNNGFNTRLASNQAMGGLGNENRHWHPMQQEANADQYPQFYGQQTAPQGQMRYPELSNMNDAYGYPSSRSMDHQRQAYDPSFGNSSQQNFGNVHMSSGYSYGLPEAHRRNEVNRYYPGSGYGDSMFQMNNPGDVYTRVFGM